MQPSMHLKHLNMKYQMTYGNTDTKKKCKKGKHFQQIKSFFLSLWNIPHKTKWSKYQFWFKPFFIFPSMLFMATTSTFTITHITSHHRSYPTRINSCFIPITPSTINRIITFCNCT